ncbi:hybrid sensor histidine kinase/response regulator transcription factor [Bacteroides sp.]|uniref:hybrid sensor histidine kinase/response regulator transcription factor n=1 Tax=Bacteroides sp. TaxID=29523 RepID=UPI0026021B28|nr:hybrid sensor histidine kinase/response regulator transcription factor [Bacteroides sp.]
MNAFFVRFQKFFPAAKKMTYRLLLLLILPNIANGKSFENKVKQHPMKKLILFVVIQLLCIWCFTLNAQRIFSTAYTMDDGLAANRVYSILQDSCGFLWFGTDDGLSRFDGIRFKNYYLSKYIDATTSNSVKKIFIDYRGRMWIGLDNGIVIYDSKTDTFIPFEAKTETGETIQSYVTDMIEDNDHNVWIATNGKGLYRFSPGSKTKLQAYRNIPGQTNCIPQDVIMTLQLDSKQNLWIGTYSEGLCRYDIKNNKFKTYQKGKTPQSVSDNSIQSIFEDSYGNLWIGTFQNGIDLFNPSTETFTNFQDKSANNLLYHIHDIKEYRPGELLVASDNGVGIFKTGTGEVMSSNNPQLKIRTGVNKFIYALYIDKEESLWLGSYFDGIKFYSSFQNNFEYYSCSPTPGSLAGKVINVVREDKDSNYWIGTDDNGIFRFNAKTQAISAFRSAADIGSTYYCIHDLLLDGDKLFAATYERGLEVFDLKTGKVETFLHNPADKTSLPSSRVFELYKASNGLIYIGTSNGVCYYDASQKAFIRIASFSGRVSCIIEDNNGTIWIGTSTNGLLAYNIKTKKIESYQHTGSPNSLTKNVITTLAIDSRKNLWIGTHGQGLCKYNEATNDFTRYDNLELPNQIITSIIPKGDVLWIATNKGLVVYNPDTKHLKVYSKSNGLYNEQFTPDSGIEASDGRFFFGSTDGFCSFSPQSLRENGYNPPVILTGMTILGKEISVNTENSPLMQAIGYTREITLEHNQSMIGFDFAALSYIAPKENYYQYMLEGLDNEWQFTKGNNNHLSYSNLQPGEYTLRIKGTNSDKIWSTNEVRLKIKVLPPFFESQVAFLIYIVLCIIIIFLSVRYYIKRSEKRQREHIKSLNDEKEKELYDSKIEFFTNIAHEIRTPLSLIIGPLEYLMNTASINNVYGEYLGIIEQNYKRLYVLVNQLLDFRKVDSGAYKLSYDSYRMKEIIAKVTGIFELTAKQKEINLDTSSLNQEMMIITDEEALMKIVSNLVSNAMKYAKSSITITAEENDTEVILNITDDGIGITDTDKNKIFDAFYQVKSNKEINKLGIGIGLHMTRSLVQLMNGRIVASDREDGKSGVSISVYLPKVMPVNEGLQSKRKVEDIVLADTCMEDVINEEETNEPIKKQYAVMVVDDNPEILDFLSKILSEEYFVISALSGEEAVQILEKNKIDLVISDVMMEDMNGFELCEKIKSNINISHIPVILLTAKTDTESKIQGLEAGADAYIDKPFSPFHLKAQLRNLFRKRESVQKTYASTPLSDIRSAVHNRLDEEFMNKCTEIILNNIENSEFSVNTLAQQLNMSRTSVFTKIKGIIDMTPNDFIKITRLKKACKMMIEGEYRITEIGFLVGFSSSSYFAKCFQKQFGMLPTEFIKNMEENTKNAGN